jgi:hypothetical protein
MKTKTNAKALPSRTQDCAKSYEPTPHEQAAAQRFRELRAKHAPVPLFKVVEADGQTKIEPDHPDPACAFTLLANAFNTSDAYFMEILLHQLANASRAGKDLTARELNAMVAMTHAIGPRDPTEVLLAAQMAAIHQATMVAARRLNHVDTIDQQDSASNMFNKLARTFVLQLEALKRHRATGEQNVHVTHQHVSVSANQAVVGVNQGGGGDNENPSQSHAPRESPANERCPTLLSHEQAVPFAMPIPGGKGPERVPDARSDSGSTARPTQRSLAARAGRK